VRWSKRRPNNTPRLNLFQELNPERGLVLRLFKVQMYTRNRIVSPDSWPKPEQFYSLRSLNILVKKTYIFLRPFGFISRICLPAFC
jgi:hypothetical protein